MTETKENLPKEEALQEFIKFAHALDSKAQTPQDIISLYDKWGYNYEYEEKLLDYSLDEFIVNLLEKVSENENIGKDAYILDLGAGTGLVGKVLRSRGYSGKIDALDGSSEMLKFAMKLPGVYDRSFCHIIEPDTAMPDNLSSGVYDATLVCSVISLPQLLHPNCLKHFANSVRVGGLVLFSTRKPFNTESFDYTSDIQREAFRLESLGIWKLVDVKLEKGYRKGMAGYDEVESVDTFIWAYKKLKSL